MAVLTVLMCVASTNAFAQEVRGVETKRIVYYDGSDYEYSYYRKTHYTDYQSTDAYSSKYYGWEFTNRNSCSVSVDISMVKIGGVIVKTKSVVLAPRETYVFKNEGINATRYDMNPANNSYYKSHSENAIDDYYVDYKAFKLQ